LHIKDRPVPFGCDQGVFLLDLNSELNQTQPDLNSGLELLGTARSVPSWVSNLSYTKHRIYSSHFLCHLNHYLNLIGLSHLKWGDIWGITLNLKGFMEILIKFYDHLLV